MPGAVEKGSVQLMPVEEGLKERWVHDLLARGDGAHVRPSPDSLLRPPTEVIPLRQEERLRPRSQPLSSLSTSCGRMLGASWPAPLLFHLRPRLRLVHEALRENAR